MGRMIHGLYERGLYERRVTTRVDLYLEDKIISVDGSMGTLGGVTAGIDLISRWHYLLEKHAGLAGRN